MSKSKGKIISWAPTKLARAMRLKHREGRSPNKDEHLKPSSSSQNSGSFTERTSELHFHLPESTNSASELYVPTKHEHDAPRHSRSLSGHSRSHSGHMSVASRIDTFDKMAQSLESVAKAVSRLQSKSSDVLQRQRTIENRALNISECQRIASARIHKSMTDLISKCGFAMLEAGTVRSKNTNNILLKNLVDACVAALIWWGIGYPLAFGEASHSLHNLVGGNQFFMSNLDIVDTPAYYANWLFHWAFAATAATIVSGAVAERCQFRAYIIYTIVITGLVYPVVVHMVWSNDGWLSINRSERTFGDALGLIDYAGSSVVHITGGGAALVAASLLGPRAERFEKDGTVKEFSSHSLGLSMLGTFILWFGWYGFNPVSGLCVKDCMVTASLAAVNTTLAAASGGVTTLMCHVLSGRPLNIAPGLNGIISGLVGVTAGCTVVEPYAAVVIGLVSGMLYHGFSQLLIRFRIDDPLDAAPVHLGSGVWGTLAVGLFATETNMERTYPNQFNPGTDYGVFYGGNGTQLGLQLLGVVVIACWTISVNLFLFSFLKAKGWYRVPPADEMMGLDASYHGGSAIDEQEAFKRAIGHQTNPRLSPGRSNSDASALTLAPLGPSRES